MSMETSDSYLEFSDNMLKADKMIAKMDIFEEDMKVWDKDEMNIQKLDENERFWHQKTADVYTKAIGVHPSARNEFRQWMSKISINGIISPKVAIDKMQKDFLTKMKMKIFGDNN